MCGEKARQAVKHSISFGAYRIIWYKFGIYICHSNGVQCVRGHKYYILCVSIPFALPERKALNDYIYKKKRS